MKKLIFITAILCVIAACGNSGSQKTETEKNEKQEPKSVMSISAEIEKDPTNAELYYRRAGAYYEDKYLDKALADIDQALVLSADNAIYLYLKGRILYGMNKTIDAAKAYERAIEVNPQFMDARLKLAELYYIVKEHKKANDLLNVVLAEDQQNLTALFFKGMNYKEMGDTTSAIQAFRKGYELDPNNYDAVMQLGILYAALKNKIALDYYIAASRIQPKNAEPPYNAGVFFQENRDYQRAVKMYEQALKADPDYYQAYYNAALINIEVGRYEDAIRNFNTVVRLQPEFAEAYYMRGFCYEKTGRNEDARINYEYAIDINPEYAQAREALKHSKR